MNLKGIEMSKWKADEAFRQYQKAWRSHYDPEDGAMMQGFKALSRGKKVINIHEVMKAGGVDEQFRPKLAIAPAHAKMVWFNRSQWMTDNHVFSMFQEDRQRFTRTRVTIPRSVFPEIRDANTKWFKIKAVVPTVPPELRPRNLSMAGLSNYHILWEAHWENVPIDPALLRHIGGPLYAILAVWDLTPLERAVLGERLV